MSHHRHHYRALLNAFDTHTRAHNLPAGKTLHAYLLKLGLTSSPDLSNALLHLYSHSGHLPDALLHFSQTPHKDTHSYNSLITSSSKSSPSLSLSLLSHMMSHNTLPSPYTLSAVFTAAAHLEDADSGGREAHCLAVKVNCCGDVVVSSALLNMYCKAGLLRDARKVFDEMPVRNSVSWTTMVSGYAKSGLGEEGVEVFRMFLGCEGERGNKFVVTSVLSGLADPELIGVGRQVHGMAVKDGLACHESVTNAVVTMYSKCGSLEDAARVFEGSVDRNAITWSAMVTGFAQGGDCRKALGLFSEMHFAGVWPSEYTFVGAVNACSDANAVEEGRQVHAYSVKMGLKSQMYVMTALVDMYAKCGSVGDAKRGFDSLREPDTVLWTSMIGGYVQNDENEAALSLYGRMEAEGVMPNDVTMASILKACSCLAALEQGKQVHARVVKYGFCSKIQVGSALSTMYAKCGCVDDGNLVFRRMPARDVVAWNSMISGLAQNGRNNDALELFEEMRSEGIKPDGVTFVNILSACSHTGLVERGWDYFNSMSREFGIVPALEHYACMVDVLSRAGRLKEAKAFIESATIDHGMCLWRILLSACKNYRDYELGAYAGERLMELGSQESSSYVILSGIYAVLGKRDDVGRVMRLMKHRGIGKEPGCSWIELKNLVHVFVVGDQMHPQIEDIYQWLRILTKEMLDHGYRPSSLLSNAQTC